MSKMAELVDYIKLPRLTEVRQTFPRPRLKNVEEEIDRQLAESGVAERIPQGGSVAITGGSRGIDNMPLILRQIVRFVKANGGEPFLIPAMGSHGGATAEGQKHMLEGLGMTEEYCECPIRSSMETVLTGYTEANHLPVYMDRYAYEADAVIVVNRIKPHPSFSGKVESGVMKMSVIGLGKQRGAQFCHSRGIAKMSETVQEVGSYMLAHNHVIFGVGTVENAYDETAELAVMKSEDILETEAVLLTHAYRNFPKILIPHYDVLLVQEMGKNISGAGMDTMIISRYTHDGIPKDPHQQIICCLRLTKETRGNANGMGLADLVPRKFYEAIDFEESYPNVITSRVYTSQRMPMVLDNDLVAIKAAIHGCVGIDYDNPRLIYMKNTLDIGRLFVSDALLEEVRNTPGMEIVGEPFDMQFDAEGNLQLL